MRNVGILLIVATLIAALMAACAQYLEADAMRRAAATRERIEMMERRSSAISQLSRDLALWNQSEETLVWVLLNGSHRSNPEMLRNVFEYSPARTSSIYHALLLELSLTEEEFALWVARAEAISNSEGAPFDRSSAYSALLQSLNIRAGQRNVEFARELVVLHQHAQSEERFAELSRVFSRFLQIVALMLAVLPGVWGELSKRRRVTPLRSMHPDAELA